MVEKIKTCLKNAGLFSVPESLEENLADHGMDSLMMVLSVAQFEKEFKIEISASEFSEDAFENLNSLQNFLSQLGAS